MAIDSLDKAIISLLAKNARQSSDELAKELHASASTIRRRIKKLVAENVIEIRAFPNVEKIGLMTRAFVGINVTQEKIPKVLRALAAYPQVVSLGATTGRFDAIAIILIESSSRLYDFMTHEVGRIEGIVRTETFVILHLEKTFYTK